MLNFTKYKNCAIIQALTFIYLGEGLHACHALPACVVELRGQLEGVGSFLLRFGSKDQTQVIKLSGKCHCLPGLDK